MRKITLIWIILALALFLYSCSTLGTVPPVETSAPDASAAPGIQPEPTIPQPIVSADGSYTIETHLLCFPDGSDISSADHVLIYALPVFSSTVFTADAYNASIGLYEEELIARITEQLETREGEPPTTYVNVEVTKVKDYTNILFTEQTKEGTQNLSHKYSIVLSSNGNEMSLAELTGMYDADVLIAQLVWNRIDSASGNTFTGITQDDVSEALDIYNGFYVTETGYTIFFDPGVLYEADKGFQMYELSEAEIFPSFVGDVLNVEAYRELLPVFSRLAAATLVNFESFDTVPSNFVSTAFMADTLSESAGSSRYGTELQMTQEDMNELFSSYFNVEEFPGADSAVMTVKEADGLYTIQLTAGFHPFSIEFTDARQEDNTVVLTGNIMYGTPGTQDAKFVSGIIITIIPAQNAAAGGYVIQSWMITK